MDFQRGVKKKKKEFSFQERSDYCLCHGHLEQPLLWEGGGGLSSTAEVQR